MDKKRENEGTECLNTLERNTSIRAINPAIKSILEGKVKNFLEREKIYLDPTMSLQKFSTMTSTNTTYLSNTINDCFGCSFRMLLNKYRVQHAKAIIKEEGAMGRDFYKRCGFASRSCFYESFKLLTFMTPLQYMKQTTSYNGAYRK